MTITEIIQNIYYVVGLLGIFYLIYRSVQKPQEEGAVKNTELSQKLIQLQSDFTNLRDNHIHTLDVRLDGTNDSIQKLAIQVTRLNTIIEERIPKKI